MKTVNHNRSRSEGANYRVFAFIGSGKTYQSVCIGRCDTPGEASALVQAALNGQKIAQPKFVLLVPESQLEAIHSQSLPN